MLVLALTFLALERRGSGERPKRQVDATAFALAECPRRLHQLVLMRPLATTTHNNTQTHMWHTIVCSCVVVVWMCVVCVHIMVVTCCGVHRVMQAGTVCVQVHVVAHMHEVYFVTSAWS